MAGHPAGADQIDRFVAQERRVYGVPAMLIGVVRDGRLTDARAAGLANVELRVAASTRQAFEIGSISKQFTAWAVLILCEQGRLALDAPVGRYLHDVPQAWSGVSLHRLLTHTSGLPDLEDAFGYGIYRQTPSDVDFLQRLAALPIEFAPGDRWRYSNTNYWLLGRVIEQVSGASYADFMQAAIFRPLGMTSTRSALPSRILPNRAAGYRTVGGVLENRDAIQPNTGRGLGDLTSTLADMARWDGEQLAPRLVSTASAERARTPVVLNDGRTEPYGYGWFTDRILPLATLQHMGQTAGFTAAYIRVPERRLAVVVFGNSYGAPTESVAAFVLARADRALRSPRPAAIADPDPALTWRLTGIVASGIAAPTEWHVDDFTTDFWAEIEPQLADVAGSFGMRGTLRAMTLVRREAGPDGVVLTYRARYPDLTRRLVIRLDAQARIRGLNGSDE